MAKLRLLLLAALAVASVATAMEAPPKPATTTMCSEFDCEAAGKVRRASAAFTSGNSADGCCVDKATTCGDFDCKAAGKVRVKDAEKLHHADAATCCRDASTEAPCADYAGCDAKTEVLCKGAGKKKQGTTPKETCCVAKVCVVVWCAVSLLQPSTAFYKVCVVEWCAAVRVVVSCSLLQPSTAFYSLLQHNLTRLLSLSKYAIDSCRIDLIPSVALERLGLHNELCSLKWKDPTGWQRHGFQLAPRIDSLKRHFESVHARDYSEDHIAHLIWGFMAIYHVNLLFPDLNDLPNLEELRRSEKGFLGSS